MSVTSAEAEMISSRTVLPPNQNSLTLLACRGLDILLSFTLLLLLVPVFLLIAVAIRLDSPGPVLFSQRRFGFGLREFTLHKFRTMHSGTSIAPHRDYVVGLIQAQPGSSSGGVDSGLYKLEGDERITRVGRRLRRFSLDETPQLLNVLLGHMSLVGPRPAIPYEVENYPPEWYGRFSVKPGITGLWQVSGRNRLNFEQMVELDLDYASRQSFWLNVRILVKTPWVMAHGKGAG